MLTAEEYAALKGDLEGVLVNVGKFLGELVEAPGGEDNDSHLVIDQQIQHFFGGYYKLKKRHEEDALSVAVLALTKSGKSTLLNALISSECLPVNNVPETARVCKISHTLCSEPSMLDGQTKVAGAKEIRQRLQSLNQQVRQKDSGNLDERVLSISAPIAALAGAQEQVTKMCLLDTPGPNEAGEDCLRFQVERLLDSVDAVIYLLDYTKLKTSEEENVLKKLKQINPQLIQRLSQRLFFVVNKADQLFDSEGLSAEDTKVYVSELITKQLGCDGFHLYPDQVLMLSARNAFMARAILSGKASDDVHQRFVRLAFGNFSFSRPSAEQVRQAAEGMLQESGILELEARVLSFLYAHSAAVKFLATVDDVVRLLQEVWNVVVSYRACLEKNVEALKADANELRQQLEKTLSCFDEALHNTEQLQAEVTDEIRRHLGSLRARLFTYIDQTLTTEFGSGPTSNPPTWRRIRDKFLSLFTSGGAAKSRSAEEMQKLLTDLHQDLMNQLQNEVGEFWRVLEECTRARHSEMLKQVNHHLGKLSREVENMVSSALDVHLEPVNVALQLPTAEQFHSNLHDLIQKGIAATQEKHVRVGQKEYTDRVLRFGGGLCRLGTYWEDVPRTRTVVETYNVTVYQLKPEAVKAYFIELVDTAINNSQKSLRSYVQQFINMQLQTARSKLEDYSDRYMCTMMSALELNNMGTDHRLAALQRVTTNMSLISALKAKALALQQSALLHVPQLQDAVDYETDFDDASESEHLSQEELTAAMEAAAAAAGSCLEDDLAALAAGMASAALVAGMDGCMDADSCSQNTPLETPNPPLMCEGVMLEESVAAAPQLRELAPPAYLVRSPSQPSLTASMYSLASSCTSSRSDLQALALPAVEADSYRVVEASSYCAASSSTAHLIDVAGPSSSSRDLDVPDLSDVEQPPELPTPAAVLTVRGPAASGSDESSGDDEPLIPPDNVDKAILGLVYGDLRQQQAAPVDYGSDATSEDDMGSEEEEEEEVFVEAGSACGAGSESPHVFHSTLVGGSAAPRVVTSGFIQVHVRGDGAVSPLTCTSCMSDTLSPSIASCSADVTYADHILEGGQVEQRPAPDLVAMEAQAGAAQQAQREAQQQQQQVVAAVPDQLGPTPHDLGQVVAAPTVEAAEGEEVAAGSSFSFEGSSSAPFDYSSGFARAMSTSHLMDDPASPRSEEEWTIIDESGEGAEETAAVQP